MLSDDVKATVLEALKVLEGESWFLPEAQGDTKRLEVRNAIAAINAEAGAVEWEPLDTYSQIYVDGEDGQRYTVGVDGDGNLYVEGRNPNHIILTLWPQYRLFHGKKTVDHEQHSE